jgi:hypothetical protein
MSEKHLKTCQNRFSQMSEDNVKTCNNRFSQMSEEYVKTCYNRFSQMSEQYLKTCHNRFSQMSEQYLNTCHNTLSAVTNSSSNNIVSSYLVFTTCNTAVPFNAQIINPVSADSLKPPKPQRLLASVNTLNSLKLLPLP